jgi:predicted DNA repair protein MutK
MSGLLALLDDVAGIAKVAAGSVDDVTAQAMKASSKAAGVVIDDAAVTPKYVTGLAPARELPIIWKITKGSIFNKLVILLPGLMLLNTFAPWVIMPLLMCGGLYLCFEGAEKVLHWVKPPANHEEKEAIIGDPLHLEEARVKGAIKTDFILSAEIMTIILNELPEAGLVFTAVALGIAGLVITAAVYGAVALIVKMDDVGLAMTHREGSLSKSIGHALVTGMPGFLKLLSTVGTFAMIWVGGSILVHGLEVMHWWTWPYETIKELAHGAASIIGAAQGFVKWFVTALLDGIIGLAAGLLLVPVVSRLLGHGH